MKTILRTAHEETYKQEEINKTLGVLINIGTGNDNQNFKESFVYIYKGGLYIFFDTIIEMFDYLLYGNTKMKRAYMEESEFDSYYDAKYIDGKFGDALEWTN